VTEISAQVGLYPLRQSDLGPPIRAAWRIFEEHGLVVQREPMSTVVWGDEEATMAALKQAFGWACAKGEVVMVITLSNACPGPG
jgi:uncharacterized protein YqgV (UPF0045/DUF77 family)